MNGFGLLLLAIIFEVLSTMALRMSEGFTRPVPSLFVIIGYSLTFYLFSLSLKHIPLSIAYAIWAGLGTAVTAMIGILVFREAVDLWKVFGIALIIGGVAVLNLMANAHAT